MLVLHGQQSLTFMENNLGVWSQKTSRYVNIITDPHCHHLMTRLTSLRPDWTIADTLT